MNKETIIPILVIIILLVGIVYAITLINKPSSELVKNLTEGPTKAPTDADLLAAAEADGLIVNDVIEGKGDGAKKGEVVSVNYIGTLLNGVKFDSSYDRNQPFEFTLGGGQVIAGWDLGVLGMKVGGKRELTIPAKYAYGDQAQGKIPASSTLKFTIELLSKKNPGDQILKIGQ
ncbi:MAG: FKBP-type peptidyl-prolyl cis-trans isomerase [Candidatus Paceibacterota bacterium]|jgi:FKBP-type peptidyl-prolyl cis-trans isomerase